ncbi:transcriptional regulator family: Fungal Specific TF [Paecilomyces variotii]|nr:transcriptional regulator family: Fungal Specific TF [Paecilomyces variotii]
MGDWKRRRLRLDAEYASPSPAGRASSAESNDTALTAINPQPDERHRSSTTPAERTDRTGRASSIPERADLPSPKTPQSAMNAEEASSQSKPSGRRRVARACEPCREQKVKCGGQQPACERCQGYGVACYYSEGKRERVAKELEQLSNQVRNYEALLRQLQYRVDEQDARLIERALPNVRSTHRVPLPTPPNPLQQYNPADRVMISTEATASPSGTESLINDATGRMGNNSAKTFQVVDYTDEDFNRNKKAQATGFVGTYSDTSWMQKLKRDIHEESNSTVPVSSQIPSGANDESYSVASVSYFLDDIELSVAGDIDPYQLPSQAVADKLLNSYFNVVHPTFPIVGKVTFMHQYRLFYSKPSVRPGNKWLAILNLIFALAAKYTTLIEETWRGPDSDHFVYFTRACQLSINKAPLLAHPDLQQVQVEGLMSFYFLTIGQVNRSWRICGGAVRSAVAMGINLRSESKVISSTSKEIRYRVWWALYTLEHLLCIMTGRPISYAEKSCTTPLPVPFEEEDFQDPYVAGVLSNHQLRRQCLDDVLAAPPKPSLSATPTTPRNSWREAVVIHGPYQQAAARVPRMITPNVSLYFVFFIELTLIMRNAIDTLYSPGAAQRPWVEVESSILGLSEQIETWFEKLPEVFRFKEPHKDDRFVRQRASLAFRYYSTRLTISRPCLRRLDRQPSNDRESSRPVDSTATLGINSACQMLALLPDEPDVIWLNRISPWWCVLHYLMQSTAVLLIEIAYRAQHNPHGVLPIFEHAKKAVRWLHRMSSGSVDSQRAWNLCDDIIRRLARKLSLDIADLPTTRLTVETNKIPTHPTVVSTPSMDDHIMHQPAPDASASHAPKNIMVHPSVLTEYDQYLTYDMALDDLLGSPLLSPGNACFSLGDIDADY